MEYNYRHLYTSSTNSNVGIGSQSPANKLDVTGTIRTVGFSMIGNSPISGYVLTASDSAGDATWSSIGAVGGWTVSGSNVYETGNGNVGIGTTLLTTAALTVMNGNVGIGTWKPRASLDVQGASSLVTFAGSVGVGTWVPAGSHARIDLVSANQYDGIVLGNGGGNDVGWIAGTSASNDNGQMSLSSGGVEKAEINAAMASWLIGGSLGIGTLSPHSLLDVGGISVGSYAGANAAPAGGIIISGNVGIGSINPGQMLDVQGTIRTTGLTMSGHTATAGYIMTASDSAGDATWSSLGAITGWTVSGNDVYESHLGNVGIGTVIVNQAALTVMNGNVGIGTWVPVTPLEIVG